MRFILSILLAMGLASPAFATSIQQFGKGATGKASTLQDDISCGADEFFRRNGTDNGWVCAAGTGAGDNVSVDGAPSTDPNFTDGGDINFTDTAGTVTATIQNDKVTAAMLADGDWGDVAISSNVAFVQDLQCTDCIGPTEITDSYLLNTGDAGTGAWDFGSADSFKIKTTTDCSTSTSEGFMCWNSTTDHFYIGDGAAAKQIDGGVGGGGAPTTVDYLVGTADGTLSNEIVVGTSPGGELGGTWASPTLDDGVSVATWTITSSTLVTPTITTSVDVGSAGVRLSDNADGGLVFLGLGNGFDESLTFDFDNVSDTVGISSTTGVSTINFPDASISLSDLKAAVDGQLIDLSQINNSGTDEGLRLPQANNCTAGFAEGQICWDKDDNLLIIGDGLSTVTISGGGSGDINAVGDCATGTCFTGASGTLLQSNTDLIMEVDNDNNGSESFQVKNGADTIVFEVDEAGLATATTLSAPNLSSVTDLDATTEATVENAIDTLNNLVTVGTITSGTWNAGAVTSSGTISTGNLTLTGSGILNNVGTLSGTTEATIEGQVFDTDNQNITGVWEVQDGVNFTFGNDADWKVQYDETTRDQLVIQTTNTAAANTTDPMFHILVGTTPTTNQQVFGVAKGTPASNTDLMTLDAEGDAVFAGSLTAASIANGPSTAPEIDFYDSDATAGDINARIYVDCSDTGNGTEDCNMTIAQQENGTEKNIMVATADAGVVFGAAGTNSFTFTTDGSGDAEFVLPNDSIGTNEILDNTITASDLANALDLGGETSLEIPNGAAPTVDAFGEIAGDNDLWAASRGAPVFYDGTAAVALIGALVSDTPSNGQVPKWNTGGTITWEADSTGGTPSINTITDATADATITFDAGEEMSWQYTGAFTTGSQFLIQQQTGNPTGAVLFEVRQADSDPDLARFGDGTDYTIIDQGGGMLSARTASGNNINMDAKACTFASAADVASSAGGFVCEGGTVNAFEAVFLFPNRGVGSDETYYIAADTTSVSSLGGSGLAINSNILDFAPSELNTLTLGSGTFTTLAFDAGATDPTFTMASNSVTVTNAATFDFVNNSISTADLNTELRSMYWGAGAMSTDGTECTTPAEVSISSGPKFYTVSCPMTTSETDGYIYGSTVLPDSISIADDVTFEVTARVTTDNAGSSTQGYIEIQCVNADATVGSTWSSGTDLDITQAAGDVADDLLQDTTGSAVDLAQGANPDCVGGDVLFWRYKICDTDATPSTGCTSSAGAENDHQIVGMKMEYTSTIGD